MDYDFLIRDLWSRFDFFQKAWHILRIDPSQGLFTLPLKLGRHVIVVVLLLEFQSIDTSLNVTLRACDG